MFQLPLQNGYPDLTPHPKGKGREAAFESCDEAAGVASVQILRTFSVCATHYCRGDVPAQISMIEALVKADAVGAC